MTAPRPRPGVRDAAEPDQLLERLLIVVEQLSSGWNNDRLVDELRRGFTTLHEGLASGEMTLPQQWGAATPPPPEVPLGTDAELEAAAQAVTRAKAELSAADEAASTVQADRETRARALGEARAKFYDLARVRDLSRP